MGRRLGQHFLRDPALLSRIVDALDPSSADVVLEVGPGPGTLTSELLRRVGRVVAIERDPVLAAALPAALRDVSPDRLRVVTGDALRVDWHAATAPATRFKVVGNIPYYITSPLIDRALTPPRPERIVFLVQREVADRLVAEPGSPAYGALSANIQVVSRVERLFLVRAGAFQPPPKVDSAVVRLTPLAAPLVAGEQQPAFRRFVVGLFGQRRKQLGRSLRSLAHADAESVRRILGELGIATDARVETLAPAELVGLFQALGAR